MTTADVLIVIDMQKGVCHYENQTIGQFDRLVSGINDRIAAYVYENKPVIFVQHTDDYLVKGTEQWEVLAELNKDQAHYFIEKKHPNAFYQTELKYVLDKLDTRSLEICGAETQYCVDSTVKFAHGLGYAIIMEKGLHTSWDNNWMSAEDTVKFYESIWNDQFVTFI